MGGGAPLGTQYIKAFRSWGIEILNGYGTTECSSCIVVNRNRYHKDGFITLTGRKKNLIILSNGENISPEELEARKNNFFMKIWNPLSGLVITIWKYLLRILNIIWGYIKKAGIFLKNRYVELKNKREKNK